MVVAIGTQNMVNTKCLHINNIPARISGICPVCSPLENRRQSTTLHNNTAQWGARNWDNWLFASPAATRRNANRYEALIWRNARLRERNGIRTDVRIKQNSAVERTNHYTARGRRRRYTVSVIHASSANRAHRLARAIKKLSLKNASRRLWYSTEWWLDGTRPQTKYNTLLIRRKATATWQNGTGRVADVRINLNGAGKNTRRHCAQSTRAANGVHWRDEYCQVGECDALEKVSRANIANTADGAIWSAW